VEAVLAVLTIPIQVAALLPVQVLRVVAVVAPPQLPPILETVVLVVLVAVVVLVIAETQRLLPVKGDY
jgi:hypothetical protein